MSGEGESKAVLAEADAPEDAPPAAAAQGLDLLLLWHMHQPEYRDPVTGEFREPWVYLHALKDYADMAAHFERRPDMLGVVNFVPVLLDQLEDYADQFATGRLRDPLLRLLAKPDGEPFSAQERALALAQCFNANHARLVAPYPAYARLHDLALAQGDTASDPQGYLSDRYLSDLVTWYHLAWTGETVRRASPLPNALMERGGGFDEASRRALLDLVAATVTDVVPRYRRLEESGVVELTTSPAWHPLAPLLIDFASAREAQPDAELPQAPRYPGGEARVDAQIASALATHRRCFGRAPDGLWPPEGGISDAFARCVARHPLRWIASGSQVLVNSLRAAAPEDAQAASAMYRPYRLTDATPALTCVFRDDRLSDLIGFEYRQWHSGDAAAHFVGELEAIAAAASVDARPLVTIIVDGENAWEHYPYNGYYFLTDLYDRLAAHPAIRARTGREIVASTDARAQAGTEAAYALPHVVAGSWVYGDFATWIGAPDKNRAWDLLAAAKDACDDALANGRVAPEDRDALSRQLAVCEGSDWFWWFGDYNPADAVARFDALYRDNLARLYALLGLPRPAALDEPISRGSATAVSEGTIRRAA
jgi:alpha-amylase/alpha-mannosidase (GH57 family)